jgi:hypothetical protein
MMMVLLKILKITHLIGVLQTMKMIMLGVEPFIMTITLFTETIIVRHWVHLYVAFVIDPYYFLSFDVDWIFLKRRSLKHKRFMNLTDC